MGIRCILDNRKKINIAHAQYSLDVKGLTPLSRYYNSKIKMNILHRSPHEFNSFTAGKCMENIWIWCRHTRHLIYVQTVLHSTKKFNQKEAVEILWHRQLSLSQLWKHWTSNLYEKWLSNMLDPGKTHAQFYAVWSWSRVLNEPVTIAYRGNTINIYTHRSFFKSKILK